jgi:hypothetical protein
MNTHYKKYSDKVTFTGNGIIDNPCKGTTEYNFLSYAKEWIIGAGFIALVVKLVPLFF